MLGLLATPPAIAAETTTYKYDALGRLIKAESTGNAAARRKTEYTRDKASNRKRVVVDCVPPRVCP